MDCPNARIDPDLAPLIANASDNITGDFDLKVTKHLPIVLSLGLLLAAGLSALDSKALEGDWTMSAPDKKGGTYIFTIFVFHVDGNRLTGFMHSPTGSR